MMTANISLKNNRSLLSKRKGKNALAGSYANVELKEFPKATPEKLNEIKEKVQQENRLLRIKQLIILSVLLVITVLILI